MFNYINSDNSDSSSIIVIDFVMLIKISYCKAGTVVGIGYQRRADDSSLPRLLIKHPFNLMIM